MDESLTTTACSQVTPLSSALTMERICYPQKTLCSKILSSLRNAGISELCHIPGQTSYPGIIGKGHSSVIALAIMDRNIVAVKIRRSDSKRLSFFWEGKRLSQASTHGATPHPYYYDDYVIVMDYVSGPHLQEYINEAPLQALAKSLKAARALDCANILHSELRRPWKHVRFTESLTHALILDLESASEGCGNIVKIISGIFSKDRDGIAFLRSLRNTFRLYVEKCSYNIYEYILEKSLSYMLYKLRRG